MKIAVNTRFLLRGKLEGLGVFSHETLKRIVPAHPEIEFIFLFDRPYSDEFIYSQNIKPVVLFPPARHPFLWYAWFEWSVAGTLKKYQPELFLSPDGYLSLRAPTRSLPVIHDLAFEHYPKDVPLLTSQFYRRYFPLYARKANRIATVSQYSKQDISKRYEIPASKIDVVYNGANNSFKPVPEKKIKEIKALWTGGHDFFIYVGALHSRKNISNLLKAFDHFCEKNGSEVKLLIVGRKAWGTSEMEKTFNEMHYRKQVIFTGRQRLNQLKDLVASATAMTYLSYFEGFGIPLVEAMAAGVPVITSNCSSLPEVGGKAALTVNPFDINEISGAMIQVVSDDSLRKKMIKEGKLQSRKFNWDHTATLLWDSIQKTLNA